MKLTETRHIKDQELLSGLIRIHILYHACKKPIFGLGMIEELQRHGYKMSAGTLLSDAPRVRIARISAFQENAIG